MGIYIGNNILGSVSGLSRTFNNTIDRLSTIANGAFCISLFAIDLLLNPAALLTTSKNFILNIIQSQFNLLAGIIYQQINKILGIPLQYLGILAQLVQLTNLITNLIFSLEERAKSLLQFNFNSQNCAAQAADFARCLQGQVNKMITAKILSAINRQVTSVDEVVNNVSLNFFNETNLFSEYTKKAQTAVRKAELQLTKVNNKLPF